jgi:serine/threonine protein kinase
MKDYINLKLINKSDYSIVYKSYDVKNNRYVAIKYYNKKKFTYEFFKNEIKYMEYFKEKELHKSLIRIYNIINYTDCYVIIMEYINGLDIFDYMLKNSIDIKQAKKIISYLIESIEFLHNHKIIHGDIKLENIILLIENDKITGIKLIDYGLCLFNVVDHVKKKSGTLDYLPPETLNNNIISYSNDIWSLGITYLFLISNENYSKVVKENNKYNVIINYSNETDNESIIILNKILNKDYKKRLTLHEIKNINFFV